jgi:transposase
VALPTAGGWIAQSELRAAQTDPDAENLTRYRKAQIQDRSREAARLHKMLEDTGIKLGCVATDIFGKSGRDMLDALVSGTSTGIAHRGLAG